MKNDKNEEKPEIVTVGRLTHLFELTDIRIQQLSNQGIVVKVERGKYDLWKSIKGYIRFIRESNRGGARTPGGEGGDYDIQRTRFTKAKADKEEVLAERMKGTMHDAEASMLVVDEMLSSFRSKMLAIPSRIAPRVADISSVNECKEILMNEIYSALDEISKYPSVEIVARQLRQPIPVSEEESMEQFEEIEQQKK